MTRLLQHSQRFGGVVEAPCAHRFGERLGGGRCVDCAERRELPGPRVRLVGGKRRALIQTIGECVERVDGLLAWIAVRIRRSGRDRRLAGVWIELLGDAIELREALLNLGAQILRVTAAVDRVHRRVEVGLPLLHRPHPGDALAQRLGRRGLGNELLRRLRWGDRRRPLRHEPRGAGEPARRRAKRRERRGQSQRNRRRRGKSRGSPSRVGADQGREVAIGTSPTIERRERREPVVERVGVVEKSRHGVAAWGAARGDRGAKRGAEHRRNEQQPALGIGELNRPQSSDEHHRGRREETDRGADRRAAKSGRAEGAAATRDDQPSGCIADRSEN